MDFKKNLKSKVLILLTFLTFLFLFSEFSYSCHLIEERERLWSKDYSGLKGECPPPDVTVTLYYWVGWDYKLCQMGFVAGTYYQCWRYCRESICRCECSKIGTRWSISGKNGDICEIRWNKDSACDGRFVGRFDETSGRCVECMEDHTAGNEWYCPSQLGDAKYEYSGKCEAACGADPLCDEKKAGDSCGNNGICSSFCECCEPYDSDNGINYFEKGTTRGLYILEDYGSVCLNFTDYCLNGTHLVEYYVSKFIKSKTVNCKSLGNYGCFDGACVGISLTLSKYIAPPNEQITATIEINGFTSSMQGKYVWVLKADVSTIDRCVSNCREYRRDAAYCFYSCLNAYIVCSCTINSTGSCSCNFNASSNPGTYNYTAFVDINDNREFDEGEYDTKSLTAASVSLTLSKYIAPPNEQITAAIKATSSMQGKTAWVLNTTVDQINNCLRSTFSLECLNIYKACTCTINSTGSCSCNFNAPSNPGTYNYTAFVDINDNREFDEGEYDTKSLTAASVSLTLSKYIALPNEQIAATIKATSSMQGIPAYILKADTSTISTINSCIENCLERTWNYPFCFNSCINDYKACTCTINSTGSCSCNFNASSNPGTYNYTAFVNLNGNYYIDSGEYDTKSLTVVASISLTLSKYQALPNDRIAATIKATSSMQGKTAYVLQADASTINSCIENCLKRGWNYPICFNSCINDYKACTCTINSTGSCSCNFNAPSNPGTYNYTAFVNLNGNYYIDSGEYDTKSLTVVASISLTLSKYQALPNDRIAATIKATSSMQGKTAYVLNTTVDQINNCLRSKFSSDCLNIYKACTCTINSTGSCSCNFNAPSNPGNYNYTGFVDLNSNSAIDSGEYDTKSLTVVASISLTLSKYIALPNEQITAIIKTSSSMQGKTAYVLKADISTINSCIRDCLKRGWSYPFCFNSCINDYKACTCTINSTGSCSCNFNAPSNPGTYNYTAFVNLNGNYYIDSGEYDTKSLIVSVYKTCNTDNDCKGDFEKNCCKNGLAAYCDAGTKICKCFGSCIVNDECQEGYCCLRSISIDLPGECVSRWNITNYQGKFYLCDPPNWVNVEVTLTLSKYTALPNDRITATIKINVFTSLMVGKTAWVLNTSNIDEINGCFSTCPGNPGSVDYELCLYRCINAYKACTCKINSTGSCSCNFNTLSKFGTYNYTGFVDLNGNYYIDSGEYDTKTLEVIGKITNKIKIRIDDTDDDQERNLAIAVNKKLEEKWWEKSEDELKRNYIVRKIDVDDVGKEIEIEVKEDVKSVELSVDSDISYWNFTIIYPDGKKVKCLNINRDRVCPREEILRIKILDNEGDIATRRFIGLGINEELPNRWFVTAGSRCKKVYPDSCVIDKDDKCIVIRVKPREIVGSTIECDVRTDIKNLYIATSSLLYNWKVEITLPDGKKYVYEVSRNLIGRIS